MAGTNYARELSVARQLAREAGVDVMRIRGGGALDVEMKPGDEPVTIADKRASDLIMAGLRAAFPDDPIISEESPVPAGAVEAPRHWFVDPIDGTKDFIRGSDGFSVMIGLVENGVPVMGLVHQPALDRTFSGVRGEMGAWVETATDRTKIFVSSIHDVEKARLVASASHRSPDIDKVKSTLGIDDEQNIGSIGVKLALIAMGLRDLYVNPWPKTKAWDTCAPEAILNAAGGRLSDLFGEPIGYTGALNHPRGLVASNGHVHDAVITKIAPLFAHLRA
ncbi:MAG: 3'(2'),5'-bisphosphate nucleotidase CysQ [Kofleriaceae bacterium]